MSAIDPISRLLEAAERATRPWPGAEFVGVVPGATADDVAFLARSTPEVVASLADSPLGREMAGTSRMRR